MRKDGVIVKNLDPIHKIMPYLMKNRCEAEVYATEKIDVTNLLKYLDKINKNREEKITLFHSIVTAMAKTIYNRPLLNRFIAGKKFYDRNGISLSFVAKNNLQDNEEERLTFASRKQYAKEKSPIEVTPSGIVICSKYQAPTNACMPICSIPSGMVYVPLRPHGYISNSVPDLLNNTPSLDIKYKLAVSILIAVSWQSLVNSALPIKSALVEKG